MSAHPSSMAPNDQPIAPILGDSHSALNDSDSSVKSTMNNANLTTNDNHELERITKDQQSSEQDSATNNDKDSTIAADHELERNQFQ